MHNSYWTFQKKVHYNKNVKFKQKAWLKVNFNYYTEKKPDMEAVKLLRLSNHAKQNKKPAEF